MFFKVCNSDLNFIYCVYSKTTICLIFSTKFDLDQTFKKLSQ